MDSAAEDHDFVFQVNTPLEVPGRGMIAVGLVRSGNLTSGELVEVWHDADFVTTAVAEIEIHGSLHQGPHIVTLVFADLRADHLRTGSIVRRAAASPATEVTGTH